VEQQMLAELERHHSTLMELLNMMRRLTDEEHLSREDVTRTRLLLTKASTARTNFLATEVYPALLASPDGATVERVRQLQRDTSGDRTRSSAHIGKWNTESISADWSGFRRDARRIIAMMVDRIDQERSVLYPLLRR
jgi:hypothetical protein